MEGGAKKGSILLMSTVKGISQCKNEQILNFVPRDTWQVSGRYLLGITRKNDSGYFRK
jgi:hypothetical protein